MGPDDELPARTLASRASDADRERAVDVLKAAFAEGRLDQDEYAERVSMALKSRTYSDLKNLTSDLLHLVRWARWACWRFQPRRAPLVPLTYGQR